MVLNPSDITSEVEITTLLDGEESVGPQLLSVPPRSVVQIVVDEYVPADVGHTVEVRTVNEVPIVAEQRWTWRGPSGRIGVASTLGATRPAATWAFAFASVEGGSGDELVVFNPALPPEGPTVILDIQVFRDGESVGTDELLGIEVPPGERVQLSIGEARVRASASVIVEADGPVVASMTSFPGGVTTTLGVPVR